MSCAFDTVDHDILRERLSKAHEIEGNVLKWIKSHLSDRTQSVVVNGIKSAMEGVSRGVPQGLVLGPILFLLYTTQIEQIIHSFGLLSHTYADDTQTYVHC